MRRPTAEIHDDRELGQYLKGKSSLSLRHGDASREGAPADLDDAVRARARAEATRQPRPGRWLAPMALVVALSLGVNLAWNVWQAQPGAPATAPAVLPHSEDAPPVRAQPPAPAKREQALLSKRREEQRVGQPQAPQDSIAGAGRAPAPAPMTEPEKIERLIGFVGQLEGVVFIRNSKEYTAADAAKHMRLKRERAGERVKTADDFIRHCASFSSQTGEAYLMRFADGRTRTAEDVLREQLATLR